MSSHFAPIHGNCDKGKFGKEVGGDTCDRAIRGGAGTEEDRRRRGRVGAAYFNTRNMLV